MAVSVRGNPNQTQKDDKTGPYFLSPFVCLIFLVLILYTVFFNAHAFYVPKHLISAVVG